VRGIEHDKPGELTCGRGRDDFPAKAALGEQRQAPAMIEVCMRQQHPIDAGGIEAEIAGILLGGLAAALIKPAIDQDVLACTLD
jgi:hypothetical protein